ncbi:myosin light chain alkali isoform X1 [Arctopsyche grandis]|uniref:myosin light chain alkali isoform X1 n=1 Tax=Arctopsyche grandis TaxID=121162 RepID=UPI00406D9FA2
MAPKQGSNIVCKNTRAKQDCCPVLEAPFVTAFRYWKSKLKKALIADLSAKDVERANFAFSIYDFDGSGQIDAINLGDVLRALNTNPTLATIEKLGGTKKKGEKKMKVDEFLPIFSQIKKDKDQGCYEDFLECLKLYDKEENGMMLSAELTHTLLSLGEKLDDAQVDELVKDCMDPEDDDGFIPYAPFLKKVMV